MKEFTTASLQLKYVDPLTEKKTTVRLKDLIEDAEASTVLAVRDALQNISEQPIIGVEAVQTYVYA